MKPRVNQGHGHGVRLFARCAGQRQHPQRPGPGGRQLPARAQVRKQAEGAAVPEEPGLGNDDLLDDMLLLPAVPGQQAAVGFRVLQAQEVP